MKLKETLDTGRATSASVESRTETVRVASIVLAVYAGIIATAFALDRPKATNDGPYSVSISAPAKTTICDYDPEACNDELPSEEDGGILNEPEGSFRF